jgi:hypothetical protein
MKDALVCLRAIFYSSREPHLPISAALMVLVLTCLDMTLSTIEDCVVHMEMECSRGKVGLTDPTCYIRYYCLPPCVLSSPSFIL